MPHAWNEKLQVGFTLNPSGQWVVDPAVKRPDSLPPLAGSKAAPGADLKTLNDMGKVYQTDVDALPRFKEASMIAHRLHTGPFRAAFLNATVPDDSDAKHPLGGAIKGVLGSVAQWAGVLPPQDISDYQKLKALAQQHVLDTQGTLKGRPMEAESARIQGQVPSPVKTPDVYDYMANDAGRVTQTVGARNKFYRQWLAQHGSIQAVDQAGQDVESAFQKYRATLPPPAPVVTPQDSSGWSYLGAEQ